jgi:peptidoglycan/LPS O-acetylase OafA/YrhL
MASRTAHVPALDGLRGVAVASVLLFHGGFAQFAGGFLGVSTFFTLSGFLVGTILITERWSEGRIDLARFAQRRSRRLLPACLAAVLVCLAVGRWLGTPADPTDLRWQAISSATFWSNWRFIAEGKSYAALFAAPSPFDHFWSLAIEAQLYLVASLLVAGLLWVGGRRRMPVVAVAVALVAGSTALLNLWFQPGMDNGRAYYSTPTRAGEFLVGLALAAWMVDRPVRARPAPTAAAGLLGLAIVVGLTMAGSLTDAWVYRGGFTLNALATATVIWAAVGRAPLISPLLALRPLRWLGRVSYGVYLYHWPVFLVLTTTRLGLGRVPTFAVRVAVTLVLAAVSARLIERPVLAGRPRRWWIPAPAATGAVVVVALLTSGTVPAPAVTASPSAPATVPPRVIPPSEIATDPEPKTFTVTTVGDGPGMELGAALAPRSDDRVVYRGTEPLGSAWSETWPQLVAARRADLLLVSIADWDPAVFAAGLGSPAPPEGPALEAWLTTTLADLVARLTGAGTTVVWVPVPDPQGNELRRIATEPGYAAFVGAFRTVFGSGGLRARFLDVQSEYNDRVRAGGVTDHIATTAELVTPRLVAIASSTIPGVARVVVVGDSVARSLGNGLVAWGAASRRAAVWDLSRDGCGVWVDGEIQSLYAGTGPLPAGCVAAVRSWPRDIVDFRPDVVVVLSTIWDLADRKLVDWDRFRRPGDPVFDEALLARYRDLVATAEAVGARVVWLTAPCTDPDDGGLPFGAPRARGAFEPRRTTHLNRVLLPRLAGPTVSVVDLFGLVCPGGRYRSQIGPIKDGRPDGLHFSEAGARWLADTHALSWLGLPANPE